MNDDKMRIDSKGATYFRLSTMKNQFYIGLLSSLLGINIELDAASLETISIHILYGESN